MAENYEIDEYTLETIRRHEGFKATAYVDAHGRSIGYGHFIKKGEEHLLNKELTREEAETLLKQDIHAAQLPWIDKAQEAGLTSRQITGLTTFAYNTGGKAIPEVIARLKEGDVSGAYTKFAAYNKSYNPKTGQKETNPELVKRRQMEFWGQVAPSGAQQLKDVITDKATKFFAKLTPSQQFQSGVKNTASAMWDKFKKVEIFGHGPSAELAGNASFETITNMNKDVVKSMEAIVNRLNAGSSFNEDRWLERLRKEGNNTWSAS